ncbi:MAG: acetylornithine deacetylase [Dongiaceae bacterium]
MADCPRSTEMLRRLVAFDTTSRNSNLALIDFVRDHLDRFGIASELVPDATGKKANLYATIGPSDRPGICLSGHTDVVPTDGQDWSTDPWALTEKDGLLYGRGTCDMKGFVAIALTWVEKFARSNLNTPVHLLLSYDEEIGCVGVRGALERLKRLPVRPKGCIIGEPTEMRVTTAHKGKKSARCRVHGHECHSSLAPKGVNAVEYAAEVISYLNAMGRRFASEGPFDHEYDVPWTTVHTGIVRGGTALNIVPKDCFFDFEFRYLAGVDPEALYDDVRAFAELKLAPEMKAVTSNAGFTWEEISAFPGLDTSDDAEIVVLAKALAQANATVKVAFGTEAGLIQEAGMPAVVCGPGSIDQAHKPNEFVALSQLALCEAFMDRLVARLKA